MKIFRYLFISLFFSGICLIQEVHSQNQEYLPLGEWLENQAATKPENENGIRIFRPSLENGNIVINASLDFNNISGEQAFLKAILSVIDNLDPQNDEIVSVDFDNQIFIINRNGLPADKGEELYYFTETYHPVGNSLEIKSSDMKVEKKGVITKKTKFEKLKPQQEYKHKRNLDRQAVIFSKNIDKIRQYIKQNPEPVIITHYQEILSGNVIKGMTPEEVRLSWGKPFSIKDSGDRIKWIYDSGHSIIFTDGVVSKVI